MIYHSILPSLTSEIPKHKMLDIYDIELIEVVKLCNITKNIGSYMARYNFANCLKQKGVATNIISESFGLQNLS